MSEGALSPAELKKGNIGSTKEEGIRVKVSIRLLSPKTFNLMLDILKPLPSIYSQV